MIDALLAGKLHAACSERTSANGKMFVVGKLRVSQENGDQLFVSLIAFRDSAKTALLALDDGDACSVAGSLTIAVWSGTADGVARPSAQVRVDAVQSVYTIERKRRAVRGDDTDAPTAPRSTNRPRISNRPQRRKAEPAPEPAEPAPALIDDELDF